MPRPWLFALLAAAWLLATALHVPAAVAQERIDRAEVAAVGADGQPAAQWRPVGLPDAWDRAKPPRFGEAWYRLRFTAVDADDRPYALYFARAGNALEILVNGRPIARLGIDSPRSPDYTRQPLFVRLPPGVVRNGDNEVLLRLQVHRFQNGGLAAMHAGPDDLVRPLYDARYATVVWGALLVAGITVSLGVLALAVWARLREPIWLYFGAASTIWGLRVAALPLIEPPISKAAWEALLWTGYGAYIALMALFSLTAIGVRRAWPRRALLAYFWANPLVCVLAQWAVLPALQTTWQAAHIGVAFAVGAVVMVQAVRTRRTDEILLAVGIASSVAVGVRDWLHYWVVPDGYESVFIARYASLVFFACMAWILVDRFSRALRGYARLSSELASRVADRERQLAQQYERLREADRNATLLSERERIMRDMHDGIGAQLVSILQQLDGRPPPPASELSDQLRDALTQLRLSIDSLDAIDGDLESALGNVRYRFGSRLETAGLRCQWEIDDLPAMPWLTPQAILGIQRILLEAMTNAVRHAGARTLSVRVLDEGDWIRLSVQDDGCGFDATSVAAGRGLANMRHRARMLGASFDIRGNAQGTIVSLDLPLQPPSADAAPAAPRTPARTDPEAAPADARAEAPAASPAPSAA